MAKIAPFSCHTLITVDKARFDIAAEIKKIQSTRPIDEIGALVSFMGLCRDEGGRMAALEIEHFPLMAQQEITRIAERVAAHFPLQALLITHRYGYIPVGEEIVLVIAASSHRVAAFEAAQMIMDYLKTDAPFWKKQHWRDKAKSPQQSDWVEAHGHDLERRKRLEGEDTP